MKDLFNKMISIVLLLCTLAGCKSRGIVHPEIPAVDEYGRTLLHRGVIQNNIEKVSESIAAWPRFLNQSDVAGRTALHYALANNNSNIAFKLIQSGADLTRIDAMQQSMLHKAAYGNSYQVTGLLIKNGVAVNKKDIHGRTALMIAAQFYHEQMMIRLIKYGASVNVRDNSGRSVLHIILEQLPTYKTIDRSKLILPSEIPSEDDEDTRSIFAKIKDGLVNGLTIIVKSVQKASRSTYTNIKGLFVTNTKIEPPNEEKAIRLIKLVLENEYDNRIRDNMGRSYVDIALKKNNMKILNWMLETQIISEHEFRTIYGLED